MPTEEILSDDYVASLLAKDAKTSNAKYSAYGLQELLPRRPINNAPKPNTRFLKNIIKETDSHNAALRAKEIAEAQSRLKRVREGDRISSSSQRDGRLRRVDDHRSKRRRVEGEGAADSSRSPSRRNSHVVSHSDTQSRSHRSDRYDEEVDEERRSRRHHKRRHSRSHHRYSRSRSADKSQRGRGFRNKSRSRSRSPRRDRKHRRRYSRHRTLVHSGRSSEEHESRRSGRKAEDTRKDDTLTGDRVAEDRKDNPSSGSDSDPLEAIIGPPPPPPEPKVKARGRGTFASTSAMDSHFSSNYDPTIDVQPDPEIDDDWDMALEALRDRQKWQKQGAERLKAAGFTEEEVLKWEKGGEKREEDVKWKGRGEGREWDRGKVVDEDGVETKPEWGRLKGT